MLQVYGEGERIEGKRRNKEGIVVIVYFRCQSYEAFLKQKPREGAITYFKTLERYCAYELNHEGVK